MSVYKVVRDFTSKKGHEYVVNDTFPHQNDGKATAARIKKLATTNNKYGQIYIEEIENKTE